MSKDMTHADALRAWAAQYATYTARAQFLAGADALDTLAADTFEYRVEHQHIYDGEWHPLAEWSPEWPLNDGCSVAPDERIVARRVSAPWVEVTGE